MNPLINTIQTNKGQVLSELTHEKPVLLIFLRQFGCVFCQEALKEIKQRQIEFDGMGVELCFVHMASTEEGDKYFAKYGLKGVPHISDPQCQLYAEFGLVKGRFNQLFGLQVWLRTIETVVTDKNNPFAKQIGDGFQMPGVFYLKDGVIVDSFIHNKASDRPNYLGLIKGCCDPNEAPVA